MALNAIGLLLSAAGLLVTETVTSTAGVLPLSLLCSFALGGFLVRTIGLANAERRGETSMGWPSRVTSWLLFGAIGGLLGLAGSATAVAALGAFVVLDAAAHFGRKKPLDAPAKPARPKRGAWRRAKLPLLATLYLAFVALVHFSVSLYLPFGVLLTWSLLAFGFALLLRMALAGPKARETDLRAPADHRRHERREEVVPDPERRRADDALQRLRAKGDVAPLLDLVAKAARDADFKEVEVQALHQKVAALLPRGGPRRDADLAAALDEIERALTTNHTLTPRTHEPPSSTRPHPTEAP